MLRGNVVAHVNAIAESIETVIRSTTEIGTEIVGIDDAA
jgi:hypothetical protein